MSLGAGISAMVNGFVGGRDIRNRWEDRADEKEWNKKLQEYRAKAETRLDDQHTWNGERLGWARDQHGATMGAYADADRLRDQQWSDDQSMRQVLDSAFGAAEAGQVSAPVLSPAAISTKSPDPVPIAATDAQPVSGPALSYGAVRTDAPAPAATIGASVAAPAPSQAPSPATDPLFGVGPDGQTIALRAPRNQDEKRQIAQAAINGGLGVAPDAAARQAEIDRIGTARATQGGMARAIMPADGHEYGAPGGAGQDVVEAGKAVARTAGDVVDTAANMGLKGVRQINQVVNPVARWMTGSDFGQPGSVSWDGGARDAMPAPPAPAKGGAVAAEVADGATQVMDAVGQSPAMQAAAEGTAVGATPGAAPMTAPQRDKAAMSFMESYRKNGVPIVQKELMRQGKFTEAQALGDFVSNAAAQDGMKSWSQAVFAAMSGDLDTAATAMIDAYNSAGYFDDGYEIVKDQTELIRDGGEVVGVKLAMRNQATGEITVSEDSISEVITKGLWLTSPEKAMEQYLAQQQAMQARLVELDSEQRKAGNTLVTEDFKATNAAALELMKSSVGLDGKPTMTYAEALQEVQTARSGRAVSSEDTPVLRRP